jgi:hypothetical protein
MQTVEGGHLNISQAFVDVRQLSTTCHQGQQVNQRLHRPLFHAFRPPHQNINLLLFGAISYQRKKPEMQQV